LNGLNQLLFVGEVEDFAVGGQLLQEKVFKNSSLDDQEQRNEISLFEAILRRAAQDNWTDAQLSDFLTGKSFSPDHTQVFARFWTKESSQIHRSLLRRTTFNNSLDNFSWRVDMNAMSKTSAELNEPMASFEFNFKSQTTASVARFDMNREELSTLLGSLQSVQSAFETILQQQGGSN
jgi:hypothetical protein